MWSERSVVFTECQSTLLCWLRHMVLSGISPEGNTPYPILVPCNYSCVATAVVAMLRKEIIDQCESNGMSSAEAKSRAERVKLVNAEMSLDPDGWAAR